MVIRTPFQGLESMWLLAQGFAALLPGLCYGRPFRPEKKSPNAGTFQA